MYRPVMVTPPAATPVTLDEVKAHCEAADFTDDDAKLQGFLEAAVSYLDGWTGILGRCLMPQTWRQEFDCFEREMRLPGFPVRSIESVTYEDSDGVTQTINASFYTLLSDDRGAFVRFKSTYDFAGVSSERPAVHVVYICGEADANAVPAALKNAIKMLVEHWYRNRGAAEVGASAGAVEVPFAVSALISPFRRSTV